MTQFDALAGAVRAVDSAGGIRIETLDNPGWMVTIDAAGLPGELGSLRAELPFWPGMRKEGKFFRAAGPPDALGAMLDALLDALGSTTASRRSDVVEELAAWYLEQCDGDWEHAYGATIIRVRAEWTIELRSDLWLDDTAMAALTTAGAMVEQTTWQDGGADRWEWRLTLRRPAPWLSLATVLQVLRTANADSPPEGREVLARLAAFEGGIAALRHAVRQLPWDADDPLVELTAWHVDDVLRRAATGEFDAAEIEEWANLLEVREDVKCTPAVTSAIFDLANPEIQGALTPERLAELRAGLATE